jgi:CHAD domain-containing protein
MTSGVIEAARRLMLAQFDILLANEEAVRAGRIVALHDFRVAMRRLRSLLRAFRKPLAGTGAAAVEARLDRFSASLGPSRDMDVWMRFLRSPAVTRKMSGRAGWPTFFARQEEVHRRRKAGVQRIFTGNAWGAIKTDVDRFLRESLRPVAAPRPEGSARDAAVKALGKAMEQVEQRSRIAPAYAPAAVHRLRIACRRARYLAEFFSAELGVEVARLGRRMKSAQDVLGDVHDIDVQLAHLRRQRARIPASLRADLEQRRRRALVRFESVWHRIRRVENALGG